MVPRPGSATPEDGVTIKQEPGVDAPSIGRSSTASEQERPDASWSSEGIFTTGDGGSDEQEGYEEQFAIPDVSPHGATRTLA
ncbi:unnamed protein product [Phytophthora fragariaefolia]|uniref:Unnamed protein product n=1 Tax=Phytophthora fragariaefolia TaxID=1490495 RepID=A0A9W6XR29_9STRA|nr:unnamed protein product [Phytophthora fragariaefolia]